MENEATYKQNSTASIYGKYMRVFNVQVRHCPVDDNSGEFIHKVWSEDPCSILEVLTSISPCLAI